MYSLSLQKRTSLDELNALFSLGDQIQFIDGPGDFTYVQLETVHGSALISLYGGHVMRYQPQDEAPVLWMSSESQYDAGKAIRGGIPVCWPWFGPHPADKTKPNHGFARISEWHVFATRVIDQDTVQVRLALNSDDHSRFFWPYDFSLQLIVTLSEKLDVTLRVRNTGSSAFSMGGALHSYFTISHIESIKIRGLEDTVYIDQLASDARKTQSGPILFGSELDNIYVDTVNAVVIEDPGLHRNIRVEKTGSQSTVVWNPWIDKSRRMSDFGDDEYVGMVCVETANAVEDLVYLEPGETHQLGTSIQAERLG